MYRRAYFGAVGRDCRSICRRTFDISGFPVRKLIHRRKRPRAGSESVARPALRVPERMNSGYDFDTSELIMPFICAVHLRCEYGTLRTAIFLQRYGRDEDDFRPSALPEDSLTGVLYEAFRTDRLGRNVRRGAVSYRSGGGFPVLRSDGCSDSLLSEVRTEQVVIRIGSGARDHLRKTRSISRRASFSLRYSRLS